MRILVVTTVVMTALLLFGSIALDAPPGVDAEVRMVAGRFVPEALTVKPGERVVFRLVSGGPHNAAFWPDSIPQAAVGSLTASLEDTIEPLMGPLLVIPDETWSVTMPDVPGSYRYYCLPHVVGRMVGQIIVSGG